MKTIDDSGIVELYGEPRKQSLDISGSSSLEKIATPTFSKKSNLFLPSLVHNLSRS